MAFLWKDPRSRYWQAGWKDEAGKRRNRSTKIEAKAKNRRTAQRVADTYEDATRKRRAARQLRETVADLHRELTGDGMETVTVVEYFERFLERKKGESGRATYRFYCTTKRDFLAWLGEERAQQDLATIRPHDLAAFRNRCLERVSEATVANKLKALRSVFRAAHREGLILEEPTAGLKLTRKGRSSEGGTKRPFTLEELRLILDSCCGEWRSMVLFGLYTGQRLGDLATLRWSNLNLLKGEMRIATRKTNRSVVTLLAQPLLDHLGELEVDDDPTAYVHPTLAALYEDKGSSTLSNQFSAILAGCGLRKELSHENQEKGRNVKRYQSTVSFHSLRATAVTLLHEAGIPAATVEEWVGHDSSEVHRTYIKIGREALVKASMALPDLSATTSEGADQ